MSSTCDGKTARTFDTASRAAQRKSNGKTPCRRRIGRLRDMLVMPIDIIQEVGHRSIQSTQRRPVYRCKDNATFASAGPAEPLMVLKITSHIAYQERRCVPVERVLPNISDSFATPRRFHRASVGHTSVH